MHVQNMEGAPRTNTNAAMATKRKDRRLTTDIVSDKHYNTATSGILRILEKLMDNNTHVN